MELYNENGYVNVGGIIDYAIAHDLPVIELTGGRGTGKTYGALAEVLKRDYTFIFMRRTQSQLDVVTKPEFSPFGALEQDGAEHIECKKLSKYHSGFYRDDDMIGYGMALSTISNVRGFDASKVDIIVFDEFIPERHERLIKDEGGALLNAYETINRNRELKGKPPVLLLLLANSNNLANPLNIKLKLVTAANRLHTSDRMYQAMPARGILLIDLKKSPISDAKRGTALYRLAAGTDFADMALDNEYAFDDVSRQASRPLREYKPVVYVGELAIYEHKSKQIYYITNHRTGGAPEFSAGCVDLQRFRRAFGWLWISYMDNRVEFEDYYFEALFTKYLQGD